MKKIIPLLICLFLSLSFQNIHAEEKQYVIDEVGVLSQEEVNDLNAQFLELSNNYDIDVVVLVSNNVTGNTQDYADDYYDYNNYRQDGILFLLYPNNREWYVSTKGICITYFTDYGIDQIVEYMDLSQEDFYRSFITFKECVKNYYESGQQGDIQDIDIPYPKPAITYFLKYGLIAGVIVTLIVFFVLRKQLKSVATERYARNYILPGSFFLTGASDLFLHSHVSKTRRPKNESHGGSSTHHSSSGSTHGGHGGHY